MGRTRESWRIFKKNKQVLCARRSVLLGAASALALGAVLTDARADCTTDLGTLGNVTAGATVTCDTDVPNPETDEIVVNGDDVTINFNANAGLDTATLHAITLNGDNASIAMAPGSYAANGSTSAVIYALSGYDHTIALDNASVNGANVFTIFVNPGDVQRNTITLSNDSSIFSTFSPISLIAVDGDVGGADVADGNVITLNDSTIDNLFGGIGFLSSGGGVVQNNTLTLNGDSHVAGGLSGATFSSNAGSVLDNDVLLYDSSYIQGEFWGVRFDGYLATSNNTVMLNGASPVMIMTSGIGLDFISGGDVSGNAVSLSGDANPAYADYISAGDQGVRFASTGGTVTLNEVTLGQNSFIASTYSNAIEFSTDPSAGDITDNTVTLNGGSLNAGLFGVAFEGEGGAVTGNAVNLSAYGGTDWSIAGGYAAVFFYGYYEVSGNAVTATEGEGGGMFAFASYNGSVDSNTVSFTDSVLSGSTFLGYDAAIGFLTLNGGDVGGPVPADGNTVTLDDDSVIVFDDIGIGLAALGGGNVQYNSVTLDTNAGYGMSYVGTGVAFYAPDGSVLDNTVTLNGSSLIAAYDYGVQFTGATGVSRNTVTLNGSSPVMIVTPGIGLDFYSYGDVTGNTVSLSGDPNPLLADYISAGGTGVRFYAPDGAAEYNSVTLGQNASITSQYSTAVSILGNDRASNNDITLNGGTLASTDGIGLAIRAEPGNADNNVVTLNNGTINSYGRGVLINAFSFGPGGNVRGNVVTVYGASSISTTGLGSDGILLSSFYSSVENNTVALYDTSTITTMGDFADGISFSNLTGFGADEGNSVALFGTSSVATTGAYAVGINMTGIDGTHSIRLGEGTSVSSAQSTGILAGEGPSVVTIAGTVTGGGGTAIDLQEGDDTLTLQTGAVLNSIADGGPDFDTLELTGMGSEDADFINFEMLTMDGTEWTLSGLIDLGLAGDTDIVEGKLVIDGVLTSPTVTVEPNGALGGMGTVVGNVTNHGKIMPPDGGVFNIDGTVHFTPGSSLALVLGPVIPRLDVTGTATIDNGSSVVLIGAFSQDIQATILTSSGLTGLFDAVTDENGAPIPDAVVTAVGGTDVELGVATVAVGNVAHQAAGASSEDAFRGFMTSILNRLDDSILTDDEEPGETSFAGLTARIGSLTGRPAGIGYAADASASLALTPLTRMLTDADTSSARELARLASFLPAINVGHDNGGVWVKGFANYSRRDNDLPVVGYESVTGGIAGGLDRALGNWLVGAVAGYARSNADLDGEAGEVDLNTGFGGLYSSYNWNAFLLNLIVTGGFNKYESTRLVTDGVSTAEAGDDYSGYLWDARAELGRQFAIFNTGTVLRPRLAVEYLSSHQNEYEDDGAGIVSGLIIDEHTTKLLRLEGQIDLAFKNLDLGRRKNVLDAIVYAGAAHEDFSDDRTAVATLVGFGNSLALSLGEDDRTLGLVGAFLELDFADNVTGHLAYNGELDADFQRHNLVAGMRVSW